MKIIQKTLNLMVNKMAFHVRVLMYAKMDLSASLTTLLNSRGASSSTQEKRCNERVA